MCIVYLAIHFISNTDSSKVEILLWILLAKFEPIIWFNDPRGLEMEYNILYSHDMIFSLAYIIKFKEEEDNI